MDLATRLLAYLRTAIGEPRLELVEHPERVTGGFDTRIFGFRLESAPPSFSGPLILRLLGTHHDPVRVLREFHPYNILVAGGSVSGVVDWPHAIVADPEFDVATTKTLLELAPLEATGLPAPVQWLV